VIPNINLRRSLVAARNLAPYNRVSSGVRVLVRSVTMLLAARLIRAFCFRSRMTPAWRRRAVFAIALLSSVSATARRTPPPPAFVHAEQLRAALESNPPAQRTQAAYERVLDAYRAVYHNDPASSKADASVLAVAQLLGEEGRLFSDEQLLYASLGQYEFLRAQYPKTHLGGQIGEGEKQARKELSALQHSASRAQPSHAKGNAVLAAAIASQQPQPARAMMPPVIQPKQTPAPSRPPPAMTPAAIQPNLPAQSSPPPQAPPAPTPTVLHPGSVALVSGIRHWSTPVYTRIAIDLGDQVAYQAARVPGPDRIYFDLYGARLGTGLNGRTVEVIDDGFLKRIRAAQFSNNVTRIVLDVSSVSDYSAFLLPNPWRLIIDIHGLKPGTAPNTNLASLPPAGTTQTAVATYQTSPPPVANRITPATPPPTAAKTTPQAANSRQDIATLGQQPNRVQATDRPTTHPIVASVAGTVPAPQADDGSLASPTPPPSTGRKKPSPAHPATPPTNTVADDDTSPPMREAEPTAAGERSLVRALGLKIGRIVIDAGHGGHDSGTVGPGGIQEKEIVLDVALRLGKLLKQRLGADVIFTRDSDTFIPLETRTAIANKAQADLFLSIHANSSSDSSARGVETYYLNFTTSPDALEVAARENAVSNESIHELSDLVKKITLKDKIDESREFAADVQKSLYDDLEDGNPGLRDRGVKKAPFVVLIGANMPSILAEISFLTNSDDAREMQQPAYRQRIAESLYRGVSRYISGLSGVRLAQNLGRPTGN
jgi:N-acetylmuramoyl-L-alanine amidase